MKNHLSILALTALTTLFVVSCGGGGSGNSSLSQEDRINQSLINGDHLVLAESVDVATGELLRTVTYDHDFVSRTRTLTSFTPGGAVNNFEICNYNAAGRLIRTESFDGSGALEFSTDYVIEDGLLIRRERISSGQNLGFDATSTISFTYDNDGNILTRSITDAVGDPTTISFEYNDQGQSIRSTRVRDIEEPYIYEYSYNSQGQLVRTTGSPEGETTDYIENFIYDNNNNVIERLVSFGEFDDQVTRTRYTYETSPQPVVNHWLRIIKFFL